MMLKTLIWHYKEFNNKRKKFAMILSKYYTIIKQQIFLLATAINTRYIYKYIKLLTSTDKSQRIF